MLDPGAPVFVPRQSRPKLDEDIETVSDAIAAMFLCFQSIVLVLVLVRFGFQRLSLP